MLNWAFSLLKRFLYLEKMFQCSRNVQEFKKSWWKVNISQNWFHHFFMKSLFSQHSCKISLKVNPMEIMSTNFPINKLEVHPTRHPMTSPTTLLSLFYTMSLNLMTSQMEMTTMTVWPLGVAWVLPAMHCPMSTRNFIQWDPSNH